jgi:hypothetical protein
MNQVVTPSGVVRQTTLLDLAAAASPTVPGTGQLPGRGALGSSTLIGPIAPRSRQRQTQQHARPNAPLLGCIWC